MGDMTVDELKDKKLWFLWSAKPSRNGKVTKVPFAANGGATGTDDAHKGTWVSFDDAESTRNQFQASGLGLKIPKGFFLLDIDHKDISEPFAQLMLSRFSSYAEVSPSGKGIHIIGQCDITKLPVHFDDRRKKLVLDSEYYQKRSDIGLELYIGDITNRYGTFTGNTINSLPIADCTQAVLTTLDKEMRKKPKAKYSAKRDGDRAVFDIVCDLRKQKNGDKFIQLYDKGDFSEYGSQSEADAALCALIAFRTGADPDAIDEVFRSSALYRSKWERDDYRENTINAGISACNGVFHRSKMEHPDFIKFNEQTGEPYVSVPLLAKYVREHLQYILVRDNGKQGLLKYVYEGGCYRLYADNMLLGIIKKYIADYDEELVKMSKVNEVLLHITTDLTGILHNTDGAKTALTAETLTYDDVISLYFSVDKEYRRNGIWLMNDKTALVLRKLKDNDGNYLWNQANDTILGKQVIISEYMPDIETGTKPIAFGDFSYYWIVGRKPVTVRTLLEKFVLYDQIGYLAFEFLDGKLVRNEAIKVIQMADAGK